MKILLLVLLAAGISFTGFDSPDLEALYRSGVTFETFMDRVDRRQQSWVENAARARVPPDLIDRARSAGGPFYLLAVAVDGCSDSVNTIPYLARLAERTDNLEMRIVDADAGRNVMMSHRTPDGRPATPTVLVLNEDFEEIGAFIERPVELQYWALGAKDSLSTDTYLEQKFAWYDDDLGHSTVKEVIALMEYSRVPTRLKGEFEDDYDNRYQIGSSTWIQGTGEEAPVVLHVIEWNAEERYAVARNGAANEFAPDRWSRIDWMSLEGIEGMRPFTWAYCLTAFDAPTAEAARAASPADRNSPLTGCGGHPFSRMKASLSDSVDP